MERRNENLEQAVQTTFSSCSTRVQRTTQPLHRPQLHLHCSVGPLSVMLVEAKATANVPQPSWVPPFPAFAYQKGCCFFLINFSLKKIKITW